MKFVEYVLPRINYAIGVLVALLGAVVLAGWYSGNKTLVQVLPTFVPMQYNTALGFMLCGFALIALFLGKKKIMLILGAVAGTIGLLTLFQYISGVSIGLDQLFMKHYLSLIHI